MRVAKQEIEVKLRVGDAAAMRRLLRRMGARAVRRVHEMNTLFDTPKGTLRKQGRLLRLREETTLGGGLGSPRSKEEARAARRSFASLPSASLRAGRMTTSAPRYVLTFKGPVRRERERQRTTAGPAASGLRYTRARYKVREETEYIMGDPRAFWAVAGPAGMRPSFRYEKYRTSYRVPGAGGVHVEFDETPAGVFLELEGSRRAIDRMARRLGYRPVDYIVRSYAALHFEECRRRGVRAGDMVFGRRKAGRG
jgi:adenylate cyclase class IV